MQWRLMCLWPISLASDATIDVEIQRRHVIGTSLAASVWWSWRHHVVARRHIVRLFDLLCKLAAKVAQYRNILFRAPPSASSSPNKKLTSTLLTQTSRMWLIMSLSCWYSSLRRLTIVINAKVILVTTITVTSYLNTAISLNCAKSVTKTNCVKTLHSDWYPLKQKHWL